MSFIHRLRFANPSWWSYHWTHRNPLRYWWRYFNSRPFPEGYSSIEDLSDYSRRHRVLGFNFEYVRSYIFWRLHQLNECTSFVETGTLYGNTAGYAHRAFKTPVFTSEISSTYYTVGRANLLWARGVNRYLGNSPDFLRRVCDSSLIGERPMFWLDAHWYESLPLAEELEVIGKQCERATILIDDFYVPWEPEFRYDEYPSARIDTELVNSSIGSCRSDVTTYLPAYRPEQEPYEKATGFAVIQVGEGRELPADDFPFNLLRKANDQ